MTFKVILEADTLDQLDALIFRLAARTPPPRPTKQRQHLPNGRGTSRAAPTRKFSPDQVLDAVRLCKQIGVTEAARASGMSVNLLVHVRKGRLYRDLWPQVQEIMAA